MLLKHIFTQCFALFVCLEYLYFLIGGIVYMVVVESLGEVAEKERLAVPCLLRGKTASLLTVNIVTLSSEVVTT